MKKTLILTSIAILTAATAGCECCQSCFRGSRLLYPQPATVYDACPPANACAPCDPCGTAAPATILPGPDPYAPAPIP